ncbi:hypothetical protein IPZ70_12735 [Streptomyces polychromogenes]|nr:hypothetical protein [Streptomyces polychromogenes]
MSNERANAVVGRITAIDWRAVGESFEHGTSCARLMREYLRRAALWVQKLQKVHPGPFFDVSQSDRRPFFDIAKYVDPSVHADDELVEELDGFLSEYSSSLLTGRICRAALNWASLTDESLAGFGDLPDPFEPLLLVFERGGAFWIENGFIDFVASRVRPATWEDHLATEPMASLDGAVLDAIDEA